MIAVAEPGTRTLSDDEFVLFQRLVKRLSGISLGPQKKPLLLCRLGPRLRALGLRSFGEYYRRVTAAGAEGELVHMLDCICTNETHFFREREQFELLRARDPPGVGEERGPRLAGSRSAPRARPPPERASEIPDGRLRAYMLRGTGASAGLMRAGPELRQIVTFRRFNLLDAAPERFGLFDLIFCRNVFIYFDAATKAEIVAKLIASLAPGGCLFLGHAEGLHGADPRVRCIAPSVYRLQPPAGLKGSRSP
ncbi:CheR family methyltransferase [Sorangium sp. So ce281]|uniref:CheR family methyltransferase n=1 Tax=unclassified Sorangium TaxID=2621164 RepID=UPI003F60AEFD